MRHHFFRPTRFQQQSFQNECEGILSCPSKKNIGQHLRYCRDCVAFAPINHQTRVTCHNFAEVDFWDFFIRWTNIDSLTDSNEATDPSLNPSFIWPSLNCFIPSDGVLFSFNMFVLETCKYLSVLAQRGVQQ